MPAEYEQNTEYITQEVEIYHDVEGDWLLVVIDSVIFYVGSAENYLFSPYRLSAALEDAAQYYVLAK